VGLHIGSSARAWLLCGWIGLLLSCGGGARTTGADGGGNATAETNTPTTAQIAAADPGRNHMGMNVGFLADWDGSSAFVDAMKHARPWQDATDWHLPVQGVDEAGWPTSDASTVILTGTPSQFNGRYKLSFKGQATVALMWSTGRVENQSYDPASNTTTADVIYAYDSSVTDARTVGLVLTATRRTPQSPLNSGFTDMHLYRPGYPADGSVRFTSPFLNALKNSQVIRMMEWNAANQNVLQHWTDRMRPSDMYRKVPAYTGPSGRLWSFGSSGAAIEHQIALCNDAQADCWFNIPVTADDEYVSKLALAIRYGTDGVEPYAAPTDQPKYAPLQAGLRIYLEYGNENWNSGNGFFNLSILEDLVGALDSGHPVMTPATGNLWYRVWRYGAWRMAKVSDQFRATFGDAAMGARVRPLLMTQQGNGQSTVHEALEWLDRYAQTQTPARSAASYLYAAGGSGYYGVNQDPTPLSDMDAFFAPTNFPATRFFSAMAVDAIWAANYGLRRVAYEGGPSLDIYGSSARTADLDPRMQSMIVQSHDAWSNIGGDLLVYYKVVGAPEWEFTNNIETTDTPKFKGLAQLASQPRAAVTLGAALPGKLRPGDVPKAELISNFYGYSTSCSGQSCLYLGRDPGSWNGLTAHADQAFSGQLVLAGLAVQPCKLKIWINGLAQGQLDLAASGALGNTAALPVQIPQGLVVIRVELLSGEGYVSEVRVGR
jgi:hypothetical protein